MSENLTGPYFEPLSRLSTPIWCFDFDLFRQVWANDAAVRLWRAESLQDLLGKDRREGLTDVGKARMERARQRILAGEVVENEATFFPDGVPVNVRLSCRRLPGYPDRPIMLVEAHTSGGAEAPADALRSRDAFRFLPIPVAVVAEDGSVLLTNAAFGAVFVEARVNPMLMEIACQPPVNRESPTELDRLLPTRLGSKRFSVWRRQAADPSSGADATVLAFFDLSEKLGLKADIQRRNEILEHLARVAAHDLREPVRGVRMFAELVRDLLAQDGRDDVNGHIQSILAAANRQLELIDNLGRYARVTSHLERAEFEVGDVINSISAGLAARIQEVDATLHLEGAPITVVGNQYLVQQLFHNLILNALEHGGHSGISITIRVDQDADNWYFSVTDDGPGVKQKDRQHIFAAFARSTSGGLGLGLAIASYAVSWHAGTISVDDGPGGQGTAFNVSFPKDPNAVA